MRHLVVTVVVTLLCSASRADGELFAVLPTESNGGVNSEAEMTGRLMAMALQEQALAVVPAETVRAAVTAHGLACSQSVEACARLVGASVRASKAIVSKLWGQAGTLELRLQVVDVRTGGKPGPWQSFEAKDRASLGLVAEQGLLSMVVPAGLSGTLSVILAPGAEILVDGIVRDRTPLLTPLKLSVGRHEVEVRYGTLSPWRSFMDINLHGLDVLRLCTTATAVVEDCGVGKEEGLKPLLVGGLIGVGVGILGLTVGSAFLVAGQVAKDDFRNSEKTIDAGYHTQLYEQISAAAFSVGAVTVLAGAAAVGGSVFFE